MANREYDYLFKLAIIGNIGVGKTALLLRFADDTFSENYITTIGVDFRFKTIKIRDTGGSERFRTITNAYYKGVDAIVIVYDTTCQQSFDDIEKFWLNEIESYAEKNAELLLLGNKSDLITKQVQSEKVQEYAKKRNMMFFATSAKTADGVEEAFKKIGIKLMAKRDQQMQDIKNKSKQQKVFYFKLYCNHHLKEQMNFQLLVKENKKTKQKMLIYGQVKVQKMLKKINNANVEYIQINLFNQKIHLYIYYYKIIIISVFFYICLQFLDLDYHFNQYCLNLIKCLPLITRFFNQINFIQKLYHQIDLINAQILI